MLRAPRQQSIADDEQIMMDGNTLRHLMQDITLIKTNLFKLKRSIQEVGTGKRGRMWWSWSWDDIMTLFTCIFVMGHVASWDCHDNSPGTHSLLSSHCSSFEDQVPVDENYGYLIFKWVAVTWLNDWAPVNTLRQRQSGCHFPDDIFKCIFLNGNVWISIKISPNFVPNGPMNNIPTLVQIMAWRRPGNKPSSEPMMVLFTDSMS